MIKAVIFDLDGTITKPFLDFDAIRKEMGIDPKAGSVLEIIDKMPPDRRKKCLQILQEHEQRAVTESSLNDGTALLLDSLRKASIKIGILTRNTTENAKIVAKKHNLMFDAIVGRDDGPVKPDGFGVKYLCEKFSASPDQALVVGDYLHDLISAKKASVKAVLLNSHKDSEQFAEYADFTIDSLEELLKIIDDINNNFRGL